MKLFATFFKLLGNFTFAKNHCFEHYVNISNKKYLLDNYILSNVKSCKV